MARRLLLHLSDLHMCPVGGVVAPTMQQSLFAAVASVASEAAAAIAVVVTGDLIDSSDADLTKAHDAVASLVSGIDGAITQSHGRAGEWPIVLMPGNHDRRVTGTIGPWSHELVTSLRDALAKYKSVSLIASAEIEPLATRIPPFSDVLDAEVVAYDTTHAVGGCFSSGGLFRAEDLLAVPGIVGSTRPVVLLLHHHLVPTPVTDASLIAADKVSPFKAFVVRKVLPKIISFADREELFMTALRSGTALTLLHALGAPVIALHGHKHYPTARVLRAVTQGDGDVLLAAAGSAGLFEPYRGGDNNDVIWPSFNALWFDGANVDIETVYFPPSHDPRKAIVRQPLLSATRRGVAWDITQLPNPPPASLPTTSDVATFTLTNGGGEYWDYECVRYVKTSDPTPYLEPIEGPPRATYEGAGVVAGAKLQITPNASVRYAARNGLCRTASTARRDYPNDDFSPFEWVWLDVRKGAKIARLELEGLPAAKSAFGTITDLHTGQERPVSVQLEDRNVVLDVPNCPARRLLRIYFQI